MRTWFRNANQWYPIISWQSKSTQGLGAEPPFGCVGGEGPHDPGGLRGGAPPNMHILSEFVQVPSNNKNCTTVTISVKSVSEHCASSGIKDFFGHFSNYSKNFDFSSVSEHYAAFWTKNSYWPLLRGRGRWGLHVVN